MTGHKRKGDQHLEATPKPKPAKRVKAYICSNQRQNSWCQSCWSCGRCRPGDDCETCDKHQVAKRSNQKTTQATNESSHQMLGVRACKLEAVEKMHPFLKLDAAADEIEESQAVLKAGMAQNERIGDIIEERIAKMYPIAKMHPSLKLDATADEIEESQAARKAAMAQNERIGDIIEERIAKRMHRSLKLDATADEIEES